METEIEFDLTVSKIRARNIQTGDEMTQWRIENDNMQPCTGESASEVVDILAECLESDDEDIAVSPQQLAGKDGKQLRLDENGRQSDD